MSETEQTPEAVDYPEPDYRLAEPIKALFKAVDALGDGTPQRLIITRDENGCLSLGK